MVLKENYVDYSSILKQEPPIYEFCMYTPTFSETMNDRDGHLPDDFYIQTNQYPNYVPTEVSQMNLSALDFFRKNVVPDNGLIVEIGVWRDPNSQTMTSTQLFLEKKKDTTHYLGIDIQDRPHVRNYKPNCEILVMDSGNTPFISRYIQEKYQKPIDFLFIDGLHTLEQVQKELALIYSVKKGGVIGFHDISVHCGPNMWMQAFDPEKFEIHKFCDTHDWGIGFLVKKF
jgi:hypothetical protein